jgi:hypothetical protein
MDKLRSDMTEPIYIRPSTVSSYLLCPGRPIQAYRPGYNTVPNEALLFGSLVHWYIEFGLQNEGQRPTFAEGARALEEIFVKDQRNDEPLAMTDTVPPSKVRDMISEADKALVNWQAYVFPKLPLEPPVIEETLEMVIGGYNDRPVILTGTPDIVYPEASLIIDWKTAGRDWDKDKKNGQIQPIAYPMLYANQHQVSPPKNFHFWVYDRSKIFWSLHKREGVRPEQTTAFLLLALQVAIDIEEQRNLWTPAGGGFKARGWHCSPQYCDAWGVCVGKFLVADGRENEPALTIKERWSE